MLRLRRATSAVGTAPGREISACSLHCTSISIAASLPFLIIDSPTYPASVESPSASSPPLESQWVRNAIHMTANSIGLSVAYFMQKTAVTFGGCTMGSEYLLATIEDLIDPLFSRLCLPTLKREHSAISVLPLLQYRYWMSYKISISAFHLCFILLRQCHSQARSSGLYGFRWLLLPNEGHILGDGESLHEGHTRSCCCGGGMRASLCTRGHAQE